MSLREARCLFTRLLADLIRFAYANGFEVALGEVNRDPRIAQLNAESGKGISNSLHLLGLAADVNLYEQGAWLSLSVDHASLGAYWKSLHPLCRWGGDFMGKGPGWRTGDPLIPKPDGNHYSISWEGRA